MCAYYYPSPQFLELQKFKNMVLKQHTHVKKKKKNNYIRLSHCKYQFSSVTQSCPSLCDPMDCSTPGFPVHHQLPELTQTHVHWVGDAIQPSPSRWCHPTIPPCVVPFSSRLQSFPASGSFPTISSLHQVAKVLELQYTGVYTANILSKYCVITSWLSSCFVH